MTVPDKATITQAIQWHEGMMLSPHHFQQMELRYHQVLSSHLELLAPAYWGIKLLKLDPIVLPDGLVRILELEAVMPDGLIVFYSASSSEIPPLEIDLGDMRTQMQRSEITIQLAIPEWREDSSPTIGDFPRFWSVEGEEVGDDNVPDNIIKIPRLLPRLILVASDKTPARCLSFPLLKVAFVEESFALTNFVTPCFNIDKSSSLGEVFCSIVQSIREKASFLSEKWQNQVGTPMLAETAALLRPLVQALPGLETSMHGDGMQPHLLHTKLCELAGLLAPLRLSQIPPVFPIYNHNDIRTTMAPVLDFIRQLLASIEQTYAAFPFHQKERLFYLPLHKAYLENRIFIGLRAASGMTEAQLSDWMDETIIVSDFAIDSVRGKRITGAHRVLLQDEELAELMPSRGVLIFEIENDPLFIQAGQNLNIFNPVDQPNRRPTEIVLYVRKGTTNE